MALAFSHSDPTMTIENECAASPTPSEAKTSTIFVRWLLQRWMLIGPIRSVTPNDAAELTFKTSDGAFFSVEQRNLWGTTDFVFKESSPGIIEVEEGANTLKILLEFVQPRRTPLLDDVSFDNLRAVAEAAEKYHIFSAMAIAHIRMRCVLPIDSCSGL